MDMTTMLAIIVPAMFVTGLVDSIAGGGGLISLPVYLMVGLPPRLAFGTNKVMAFTGSVTTSYRYYKEGFFDRKSAIPLAVSLAAGELMGTGLVYLVPEIFFSAFLSIMLPAAALFTFFSKKTFHYDKLGLDGSVNGEMRKLVLIGLVIGLYSGTIGAAGSTVGMLLLCTFIHYDIRTAHGTLKFALAVGSALGLSVFIFNGDVNWVLAVPSVLANMVGNYIGSGIAVKNGAKIIRPVALIIVLAYTIKTFIGFAG